MRLAHISDFHFTHLTWNPLRLLSKRALGTLNWITLRKKQFFEEQVEQLPQLLEELKVDRILLGGDFSTTSLKEEFEKAQKFISKFKQPWYAIPGNHDRYTRKSCKQKHFYRYFSHKREKIDDPVQFFNLKEHRIETHYLDKNWYLITLDTAIATNPYSSEGIFSETLEQSLLEVLTLLPKDAPIILLNHFPFFQNDVVRHNLIRGKALQKILEDTPRIRLYLHGHTHRHTVADLQVSNLPIVLDSGSCTQGKKGAWNLIDLKDEGCAISTYRWDHKWTKTRIEEFKWTR